MRRFAAHASRLAFQYATSTSGTTATSTASICLQRLRSETCCTRSPTARPALASWLSARTFSSNIDVSKEVDAVNELFAAARDEIEYAKEEAETVYFNESVAEARKAVEACMGRWEALLAGLSEEERARVVRSMGLKIAQLQAEYDEVSKLHLED